MKQLGPNLHSAYKWVRRDPRPKPLVEFASADRIEDRPDLREDFVRRVLKIESAFISDESTLWDFHEERTNDEIQTRIMDVYGVDVHDIQPPLICDVLDRIASVEKTVI